MENNPRQNLHYLRCAVCGKTQRSIEQSPCQRCQTPLYHRKPYSFERSAAYLLTALFLLFPANLLPISFLTRQGQENSDTIFSGVITLINQDMLPIAIIVFCASIAIPILKILCMSWILLSIKTRHARSARYEILMFRVVDWIGRWSILDLFVIALMMTLLDREELLSFSPGPGATAFALVVLFTLLSAKSLDTRLIWDNHNTTAVSDKSSQK